MEMDGWVDGWMDGVKGPSRRPCSSFSRLRLLKFSRLPPHFYIFFFFCSPAVNGAECGFMGKVIRQLATLIQGAVNYKVVAVAQT